MLDTDRPRGHRRAMPSPCPPDHCDPAPPSRGARWLVEVGPLAVSVALLWAKLVYFSALLPSE